MKMKMEKKNSWKKNFLRFFTFLLERFYMSTEQGK